MQRDLSRDREQSGVITWPSSTEINDARFALPTTRIITQNSVNMSVGTPYSHLPRSVRHTYGNRDGGMEESSNLCHFNLPQACKSAHPSSAGETLPTPPASISQGLRMSHGPRQTPQFLIPRALVEVAAEGDLAERAR